MKNLQRRPLIPLPSYKMEDDDDVDGDDVDDDVVASSTAESLENDR